MPNSAGEGEEGSGGALPLLGVAALDAAGGQVLVGAWRDDEVRQGRSASGPKGLCASEGSGVKPPLP
jgi:hypothetical protein